MAPGAMSPKLKSIEKLRKKRRKINEKNVENECKNNEKALKNQCKNNEKQLNSLKKQGKTLKQPGKSTEFNLTWCEKCSKAFNTVQKRF